MNLSSLTQKLKGADRFPKQAGLDMQRACLAKWKTKLNLPAYTRLCEEINLLNGSLPEDAVGYDVARGDTLTLIVVEMDL